MQTIQDSDDAASPNAHHTQVPTRARSGSVQISAAPGTLVRRSKSQRVRWSFLPRRGERTNLLSRPSRPFLPREKRRNQRASRWRVERAIGTPISTRLTAPSTRVGLLPNACARLGNRVIILNGRYSTASHRPLSRTTGQAKPGQNTMI